MPITLNSRLEDYAAIEKDLADPPILLLGNGASRAVWEKFGYHSLFELASDPRRPHHLSLEDKQFFRQLDDTKNFEQVLSSLTLARQVNEILNVETVEISERYESIRQSLIRAVKDIHVPYADVTPEIKKTIRDELSKFRAVYSTNYDLLLYWSYMNEEKPFKDFFWGEDNAFNTGDCELRDDTTVIYYIHGALHLYKLHDGATIKLVGNQASGSLLNQFDMNSKRIPLFVSEGTWRDKRSAILRNDYLSFAYRAFCQNHRKIVMFGHNLHPEFDNHILDAIRRMKNYSRKTTDLMVAISVYPTGNDLEIIDIKRRMAQELPGKKLRFFDSRSHPLGIDSLRLG